MMSKIDQALYDYLSPAAQQKTDEHLAALEVTPNTCRNCEGPLPEDQDFCDDECKDAWRGIDRMQIEREKTAGQREDAEDHRQELVRVDMDRLRDETVELMIREEPELDEDRLRDQEQDR